jgi:hypothetical protein
MFSSEVSAAVAGVPAIAVHDAIAVVLLLLAPLFHNIAAVSAWLPKFFDAFPTAGVQNSKEESSWGLASTRKTKQRVYIYCKANVKGRRSNCSVLLTFTVQSETTYYGGKIVYIYGYWCTRKYTYA